MTASDSRFLYFFLFLPQGMIVPFLTPWMVAKGIPMAIAGGLLAFSYLSKAIVNPYVGRLSDRIDPLVLLRVMALGTALLYLALPLAGWQVAIVIIAAVYLVQPGMYPICERVAADIVLRTGASYGRMRLWGSTGFAVGGVVFGWAAGSTGLESLNSWIAGCFLAACLLCLFIGRPVTAKRAVGGLSDFRSLKGHAGPVFAGSLCQASNAFLYSFGGLYLLTHGWQTHEVALLWSLGIAFEIAALSAPLDRLRLGPQQMLALSATFTAVRWTIFAFSTSFAVLAVAQVLQAFTIGVNNTAFMSYVNSRAVDERIRGSLIGTYGALANGLLMGSLVLVSSLLYPLIAQYCFAVMALAALVAGAIALVSIPPAMGSRPVRYGG